MADENLQSWSWFRAVVGPGIVVGGVGLMQVHRAAGIIVVYLGFMVCLIEIVREPFLVSRSYIYQVVLIAALIGIALIFTLDTFALYQITILPSVVQKYEPSTEIDGVLWQPEFTQVKIILSNDTDEDYEHLDAYVELDGSAIKGTLVNSSNECHVDPPDISNESSYIGRGHTVAGFEMKLNGVVRKLPLLASDIYRVQCQLLASHSSIGMSFIEVGLHGQGSDPTKVTGVVIERGKIIGMDPIDGYARFTAKRFLLDGSFRVESRKMTVNRIVNLNY